MIEDRRAASHNVAGEIQSGTECGYNDVVAVGDGKYRCTRCKLDMAPHWPALVLAAGLKLPKWPKNGDHK